MYSAKVLDHFQHPRNAGEIAGAAVVETSNPACGDTLKLWAVIENGTVRRMAFQVQGCVPAVACGSWLAERAVGRRIAELGSITPADIEAGLDGLPPASRHAAVLAVEALRRLLEAAERAAARIKT
jgi:nitrogen fixation NifU-like protein